MERLPRLASHLLEQRQFLPLHPVPVDEKVAFRTNKYYTGDSFSLFFIRMARALQAPLAVDYIANFESAGLNARPDILLVPSDLAPFAKEAIGGVLCINSGRLTRKQVWIFQLCTIVVDTYFIHEFHFNASNY